MSIKFDLLLFNLKKTKKKELFCEHLNYFRSSEI